MVVLLLILGEISILFSIVAALAYISWYLLFEERHPYHTAASSFYSRCIRTNTSTFAFSRFSSVAQSCLTLCDSMDCIMPGFPVIHQLPELTRTHVHWVSDAIQPSHPLSSPSPPTFSLSQHQGLFPLSQFFPSGGQSIGVSASASVLPVQGTLRSLSPTPQFKSINSSALSFLYSPTLTSIHDYWKNHSFD